MLLAPEVIVTGLAANEVIEGAEAVPPVEPELPEPLDPVDVPVPVVDVFVALLVWPQAPRPTQSRRVEISAPRENCGNRTARLETGDPIVDTPHDTIPWAPVAAILAKRTELVAVPWLGTQ